MFKALASPAHSEELVDGSRISFHVATRVPLDYKGTVDDDRWKGTIFGNGKTGDWAATRSNEWRITN